MWVCIYVYNVCINIIACLCVCVIALCLLATLPTNVITLASGLLHWPSWLNSAVMSCGTTYYNHIFTRQTNYRPVHTHFDIRRYTILITLLHSGVPCTSCGLRFKSESTDEYRHHLDWHYQMNRREREGSNKTSRNWYIHPEVCLC